MDQEASAEPLWMMALLKRPLPGRSRKVAKLIYHELNSTKLIDDEVVTDNASNHVSRGLGVKGRTPKERS